MSIVVFRSRVDENMKRTTVAAWIDEHFVAALAIAGGDYSAMPVNDSMT